MLWNQSFTTSLWYHICTYFLVVKFDGFEVLKYQKYVVLLIISKRTFDSNSLIQYWWSGLHGNQDINHSKARKLTMQLTSLLPNKPYIFILQCLIVPTLTTQSLQKWSFQTSFDTKCENNLPLTPNINKC